MPEVKTEQLHELLYQALETEQNGQRIYKKAIECADNDGLAEEWQKYLSETETHEKVLRETFQKIGLDAGQASPGRDIVKSKAEALISAMDMALQRGGKAMAQLVAAESVVEAETKDHANWVLIGHCAKHTSGDVSKALKEAHEQVEDEEDEHLYHTMGWCRELWIQSLGLPAALPPPEEEKSVKTAIGQARAEHARDEFTS